MHRNRGWLIHGVFSIPHKRNREQSHGDCTLLYVHRSVELCTVIVFNAVLSLAVVTRKPTTESHRLGFSGRSENKRGDAIDQVNEVEKENTAPANGKEIYMRRK